MAKAARRSLFRSEIFTMALVLAFFLCLLAGSAYLVRNAYLSATELARVRVIASADVVAANVDWLTETSRQLLQRVDDFVGPDLDHLPENALGFLKESVVTLPGAPRIYLVGADGSTRLTTDPDFKPIDIRDRDYFKAVAEGTAFYVSPMLISRLNGEQIFVISKSVERNGVFMGAAIVSFNSQFLKHVWESLRFESTSTVSIVRDDGEIVARHPPISKPMNVRGSILFGSQLASAMSGSYEGTSLADGVQRIVAFRRLDSMGLIALASIERDVALAPFYKFSSISLALGLPTTLFLAFLAWVSYRWLALDADRRDRLAAALDFNQMLFREIHHRVKNNLQAVNSLIGLQKIDPVAKKEMSQRIQAMVAVHEQIYRNDQFGLVDASAYIPSIIDKLLESCGQEVRLTYDLQPLEVDREHALPLGLITNEVVSNAMKYAFGGKGAGELHIGLRKIENDAFGLLTVRDNGAGFDPDQAAKGMGSRLINGLAAQIHGKASYRFAEGTEFELRFPLPTIDPAAA